MSGPYGGGQPGWDQWPAGYGGQQFGAGPPGGGAPPGGGPDNRNRNLVIAGSVGAVGVVLVVAVVVAMLLHNDHKHTTSSHATSTRSTTHTTTSSTTSTTASSTTSSAQSATDCTPNVSTGGTPVNGVVSAGGLSFAQSVAPGWTPEGDIRVPNVLDSVTLAQAVSSKWRAQITVGVTNFDQSLSLADQAKLMFKCVLTSSLYTNEVSAMPEVTSVASGRIDGVTTAEVDVPVPVTNGGPSITGDDVDIIIVETKPSTVFLGTSPFGDTARRDVVRAVAAALRVNSD